MKKDFLVYRCKHCGKIVYVLKNGMGQLKCCGTEMDLLVPNTTDGAGEKHVPYVINETVACNCFEDQTSKHVKVQIGSVLHPMLDEHYIEWIAVADDARVTFKFLSPGQEPLVHAHIKDDDKLYEYCNLHGLWKK